MKKKINRMLVLISSLAIFATLFLITFIYYDLFKQQMFRDLKSYALIAGEGATLQELSLLGERVAECDMRMTVVGRDGQVLLDTEANQSVMENHGNRPEIAEAFAGGEGAAVRRSQTLSRNTFYYAVRLQDGSVLRVSKDAGSIYSILSSAFPSLIWVLALLILISLGIAHFLTGKLIAPIVNLASKLDEYNDETDYEELTPFIATIRKQHQDILKNARMRQEFTANVSHELKTPLTSITGYAELIETGMASGEDVVRFAHGIRNSATRLLTLINDTIRLSELDGGEEQVDMTDLNLYQMAADCVDMLRVSAEKHQVEIALHGHECHMQGNRQMIEELLYNLCDNAIRYNNAGGRIDVEVYPDRTGCVLVVRDTGIGIPKEHQERIFERFYRVDKSRSKSTGGTGLGLAIVKHIVNKHNAKLELKSEAGEGTMIRVLFPR